ncbi:hypothetical protein Tco_0842349 [Tanacetum coccineum]|uniref:Uncharacterized protein n=1 Tax=Tanacetum coccineum TaxID=301880 RepID=A0ABQ5B2H4_9ASTR
MEPACRWTLCLHSQELDTLLWRLKTMNMQRNPTSAIFYPSRFFRKDVQDGQGRTQRPPGLPSTDQKNPMEVLLYQYGEDPLDKLARLVLNRIIGKTRKYLPQLSVIGRKFTIKFREIISKSFG